MRLGTTATSVVLLLASASALANTYNPVGGSGGGISGSGTLYTSSVNGVYTITGITGDATDGVNGLISVNGYRGNDNLLFPTQTPTLDGHGFGFTDTMGDTDYQVDLFYSADAQAYEAWVLDNDNYESPSPIPVTFTVGPTQTEEAYSAVRRLAAVPGGGSEAFAFSFTGTAAETPEPTSVALLGTGLLGTAGVLRRRKH